MGTISQQPASPVQEKRKRISLDTPKSIFHGLSGESGEHELPSATKPAPVPVWPWVLLGVIMGAGVVAVLRG